MNVPEIMFYLFGGIMGVVILAITSDESSLRYLSILLFICVTFLCMKCDYLEQTVKKLEKGTRK